MQHITIGDKVWWGRGESKWWLSTYFVWGKTHVLKRQKFEKYQIERRFCKISNDSLTWIYLQLLMENCIYFQIVFSFVLTTFRIETFLKTWDRNKCSSTTLDNVLKVCTCLCMQIGQPHAMSKNQSIK